MLHRILVFTRTCEYKYPMKQFYLYLQGHFTKISYKSKRLVYTSELVQVSFKIKEITYWPKTTWLNNQIACMKRLHILFNVDCVPMMLFFNVFYFNNLYLQVKTGMIG